jgi:SM-20-related protein
MNEHFDLLIDSYLSDRIGIAPAFLTPQLATGLRQNIVQLQQDELMIAAGIGNAEIKDANQIMRSDKIYWLDKKHENAFENEFLQHAEDFIDRLNNTCYAGINGYEFHYAVYEEGSFYKRHIDQFKNNNHRKFSLITYLNEDWQSTDGGQLQVYHEDAVTQIQPNAQTAVLFKSDETEHEVIKANRSRMSITGWLKVI